MFCRFVQPVPSVPWKAAVHREEHYWATFPFACQARAALKTLPRASAHPFRA